MNKKTLLHSKLNNQRGVTAVDIVVSITMIVISISIVMAIYVNINISSREVTRKAAATRMATNMLERIDIMYYDEVLAEFTKLQGTTYASYVEYTAGEGFSPNGTYKITNYPVTNRLFNTTIPKGYTINFEVSNVYGENDSTKYDLVKKIKITVEFAVGKKIEEVTLTTTKEFIKLNQLGNDPVFDASYFMNVSRIQEDIPSTFTFDDSIFASGMYAYVTKNASGDYVKVDTPTYVYSEETSAVVPCAICVDPDVNINPVSNKVTNTDKVFVWIPAHYIDSNDRTKIEYRYKATPNPTKQVTLTDVTGSSSIISYTVNSAAGPFNTYEEMNPDWEVIINGTYKYNILNLEGVRTKEGVWVNPYRMDEVITEEGIYEEYFNKFWDAIN